MGSKEEENEERKISKENGEKNEDKAVSRSRSRSASQSRSRTRSPSPSPSKSKSKSENNKNENELEKEKDKKMKCGSKSRSKSKESSKSRSHSKSHSGSHSRSHSGSHSRNRGRERRRSRRRRRRSRRDRRSTSGSWSSSSSDTSGNDSRKDTRSRTRSRSRSRSRSRTARGTHHRDHDRSHRSHRSHRNDRSHHSNSGRHHGSGDNHRNDHDRHGSTHHGGHRSSHRSSHRSRHGSSHRHNHGSNHRHGDSSGHGYDKRDDRYDRHERHGGRHGDRSNRRRRRRDGGNSSGARSRSSSFDRSASTESKIVFVGNLPPRTNESCIQEAFDSQRGNRISSRGVLVTRVDLKGTFAFVHIRGKRLNDVVRQSNGMYWGGNRLTVELAKSNEIRKWNDRKTYGANKTLFVVVNCEAADISEDDIGHLFGKYGNIARVSLRRTFAFVEFVELDDATKAKDALQGYTLKGVKLVIRYAASPSDKRREDELNRRQRVRRKEFASRGEGSYRGGGGGGSEDDGHGHNGNNNNDGDDMQDDQRFERFNPSDAVNDGNERSDDIEEKNGQSLPSIVDSSGQTYMLVPAKLVDQGLVDSNQKHRKR